MILTETQKEMYKNCMFLTEATYSPFKEIKKLKDEHIFEEIQTKYNIELPKNFINFFKKFNGAIPTNHYIKFKDEEYEVRYFLSFNKEDHNSVLKPLDFFMKETHKTAFPFATDSGSNYFVLNLKNKKVYYWEHEGDNEFYPICGSFTEFMYAFNKQPR